MNGDHQSKIGLAVLVAVAVVAAVGLALIVAGLFP